MTVPIILFTFLITLFIVCVVAWLIDMFTDSTGWEKNSEPSLDATIIEVTTNKVFYKNALKTLVRFSDGYRYRSYKSKREDDIASQFTTIHKYTLSVELDTKMEICEDATEAHNKAVRKKLKLPKEKEEDLVDFNASPEHQINPTKWVCTCGRVNAHYTSTCVCGVNKRQAITKNKE